jgi:serine/threonine protein kinase
MNYKNLGYGAFGTVYIASCKTTKSQYAIKEMSKEELDDHQLGRLRREIDTQKKISHPGICTIHDCYEDDSKIYLRMELCKGGQLTEMMVREGTLDE